MSTTPTKLTALIVAAVCFLAFVPGAVAGRGRLLRRGQYVPGELLVKYKHGARSTASNDPERPSRFTTLRKFNRLGIHHVKIAEDMTVQKALEVCRDDPAVEYAEPNYVRRVSLISDDYDYDAITLWGLEKVDAPEAWDIQTGNSVVVVAVLDTGADWGHVDLNDNIWENSDEAEDGADTDANGKVDDVRGWDFVNNDNNPYDDNGHGTHVSGTIGATGDNGTGVVGVNWSVSIMPLKILYADGSGYVSDEIEAIEYAIAQGAHVINASFSGSFFSQTEYDAISMASVAGILFVAAAGNYGDGNNQSGWNNDAAGQANYPASYDLDNIIAVAATDHNDTLAYFSNYGATTVDVAAPGVNIRSTCAGGGYCSKSGTSMATPHVAGLAALIWAQDLAQHGGFTFPYDQVKDRILNGVEVFPALTGEILMAGRINARNSVDLSITAPDPAPSDLVVTPVSESQLDLTWSDNSDDPDGESGFKIERAATAGGPYSHIATVPAGVEAYSDVQVPDGTNYYRVGAFNAGGTVYSNQDDAIASLFAAPSNLLADPVSSSEINLTWSDNSAVEWGYKIERKTSSAGLFAEIASVGQDVGTYSDSGLNSSTSYDYRVRAFKGNEFSDYSTEVSVETLSTSNGSSGASSGTTPTTSNGDESTQIAAGGGGGGGGCFISTAAHGMSWFPALVLVAFISAALLAWTRTKRAV